MFNTIWILRITYKLDIRKTKLKKQVLKPNYNIKISWPQSLHSLKTKIDNEVNLLKLIELLNWRKISHEQRSICPSKRIKQFPCKKNILRKSILPVQRLSNEQHKKHWHWETKVQPAFPRPCLVNELGQCTNSQDDFKTTVLKPIKVLSSFPYLCFPGTFTVLLNSLKNILFLLPCPPFKINLRKWYIAIAIPSTLGVTLLGLGRKTKLLPGGHTAVQCFSNQASYRICCNRKRLVKGEGVSKCDTYLSKNEN